MLSVASAVREIETSLEVMVGERSDKVSENFGFISLNARTVQLAGREALFSFPYCHDRKQYVSLEFDSKWNGILSCQIDFVLTVSRSVHYMKVIGRDFGERTRSEWEQLFTS